MSNSEIEEIEKLCQETDKKIRDPEIGGTESAWIAIDFADKAINIIPKLLAQNKKLLEFIRNEAISRYCDRFKDMIDNDELREASEAYGDTYLKSVMKDL